jgi:hypothetical protein
VNILDLITKQSNNLLQTGILEKDGGQWRFRHQLLQDALGR